MFQFTGFPLHGYLIHHTVTGVVPAEFPHSDICGYNGYLLLPAAFRSLSRLSSALSAKASTLRSLCITYTNNLGAAQVGSSSCEMLAFLNVGDHSCGHLRSKGQRMSKAHELTATLVKQPNLLIQTYWSE